MATRTKANNTTALNLTGSWVGGVVPTAVDTASWNNTVTGANTVALGANAAWLGLTIENPGGNVTIGTTSATLTLGINGINMLAASRDLIIASPVAISWVSGQTWNVASNRTLAVSSTISGGNLSINTFDSTTTGNVFLTGGAGAISGTVGISYGALYLADYNSGTPNQLGTGSVSLSGDLFIQGATAHTFTQTISGSGGIYMSNTSASGVTVDNFSGFTGPLRIYAAFSSPGDSQKLKIAQNSASALSFGLFDYLQGGGVTRGVTQTLSYSGNVPVSHGNFFIINAFNVAQAMVAVFENESSNASLVTLTTTTQNNASSASPTNTYRLAATNGPITQSGNITEASTGTLNLSKTGSNTVTLSGANTFRGTVSVSAGTLNANSATALGAASSTAAISVTSGATLSLGAALNYSSPGRTTTISGTGVSGVDAGCLVLANAGPLNLGAINATNNTYIRGTTTTQLTSAIAWSGSGGLRLGAATGTTATFSGAISVSSGTLTALLFGRSNNPDLGTVVLGTTNTFAAPAQIDFGTLRISADANLGTAPGVATSAYLIIGGNTTLATTATFTLNPNRGIALGPSSGSGTGTIDVASATTLTYAGIIANNNTGTGKLVKSSTGTLKLTGANTYSGGSDLGAGTTQAGNTQALGTTGTVTLTASGATLQTITTGGQNGKLTVAALTNSAGGTIKIGG